MRTAEEEGSMLVLAHPSSQLSRYCVFSSLEQSLETWLSSGDTVRGTERHRKSQGLLAPNPVPAFS